MITKEQYINLAMEKNNINKEDATQLVSATMKNNGIVESKDGYLCTMHFSNVIRDGKSGIEMGIRPVLV